MCAVGWAHDLVAARPVVRARAPRVIALEDSGYAQERDPAAHSARLPSMALAGRPNGARRRARRCWSRCRAAGYVPALACGRCRTIARCRHCTGPLSLPDRDASGAVCRWCGREEPALRCARCGSDAVRAVVVGARRTAEELGRAFPGTTRRHLRRRRHRADGAGRSGACCRHPGRRAVGRRRVRRRAAAGRLGIAGASGSPRGRGHAAPLDGRRARWCAAATMVASSPWSPNPRCRPCRHWSGGTRSGTPRPSSTPAPRWACRPPCTWPPLTAPPVPWPHFWKPLNCPTPYELLGPVDLPSGARRPPGDSGRQPRQPDAGAGAPRTRGWSWRRRCGGPPECSAPGTISSRFGCKSTRCT